MKIRFHTPSLVSILFTFILLGASSSVFAHTHLHSSIPTADAKLTTAPEQLTLVFDGEVNLVRLNLDRDGNAVALDFQPSAQKALEFAIPLPVLDNGSYVVRWAAIGEDGHLVQGSIPFSVNASP